MTEVRGKCSKETVDELCGILIRKHIQAVKAPINGRIAIVTCNTWYKLTVLPDDECYITARLIEKNGCDVEAELTPSADLPVLQIINRIRWDQWP
jgi:hypothetical protein